MFQINIYIMNGQMLTLYGDEANLMHELSAWQRYEKEVALACEDADNIGQEYYNIEAYFVRIVRGFGKTKQLSAVLGYRFADVISMTIVSL